MSNFCDPWAKPCPSYPRRDADSSKASSDESPIRPCEATLQGHRDTITGLVILPDQRVASGSRDGRLRVWARKRGCVKVLNGVTQICVVAGLPDGRVATGHADKTIKVWDLSCDRSHTLTGQFGKITCLAGVPDGVVAAGESADITYWKLSDGSCTTLRMLGPIRSLAALQGGRIASGSSGTHGELKVWNLSEGRCVLTIAPSTETAAQWNCIAPLSEDRIACGSRYQLLVWSLADGRLLKSLDHGGMEESGCVTAFPDGRVATCALDSVKIWDILEGRCLETIAANAAKLWHFSCVAACADGRLITASEGRIEPDRKLFLGRVSDNAIRIWYDMRRETEKWMAKAIALQKAHKYIEKSIVKFL